jgi:hypothetical protein
VSAQQRYTVAEPRHGHRDRHPADVAVHGDAIPLAATARRADGSAVNDAPITWSYTYRAPRHRRRRRRRGHHRPRPVRRQRAGLFTLLAQSGARGRPQGHRGRRRATCSAASRHGRGSITSTHTSDLWPWTGKDGRDYVLVGTWGGDGYAFVFDITDMNNIVKTDSVRWTRAPSTT